MFRRTIPALFCLVATCACYGQEPPELGLFLKFDIRPSRGFVKAMEAELGAILLPTGLRVRWLEGASDTAQSWRTMVFRFHGTCAGEPESPMDEPDKLTLADTAVLGDSIQPFSETDCDRLRGFLASVSGMNGEPRLVGQESRLGRAMARLMAHELYHYLLQTRVHGKTGIAKAVHTPAALLGRSLRFQSDELERMRLSLSAPPLRRPAGAPVAAFAARTAKP